MKTIKRIATLILRQPVEETGVGPLMLFFVMILIMAFMMKFCYCK